MSQRVLLLKAKRSGKEGKRPDSITIRLKANGEEVKSTEVSEDDDWAWKFENLPKSSKGKDIIYTISEDTVKDYTTEITKEEPDTEGTDDGDESTEDEKDSVISFTVTNNYDPGKTQVSVSKVWKDEDNQDGIRPESVVIILLAGRRGDYVLCQGGGSRCHHRRRRR